MKSKSKASRVRCFSESTKSASTSSPTNSSPYCAPPARKATGWRPKVFFELLRDKYLEVKPMVDKPTKWPKLDDGHVLHVDVFFRPLEDVLLPFPRCNTSGVGNVAATTRGCRMPLDRLLGMPEVSAMMSLSTIFFHWPFVVLIFSQYSKLFV